MAHSFFSFPLNSATHSRSLFCNKVLSGREVFQHLLDVCGTFAPLLILKNIASHLKVSPNLRHVDSIDSKSP